MRAGIYDSIDLGECYIVRPDGSGAYYNRWADNPRWAGLSPASVPVDSFFEVNCKRLASLPKDIPASPFKIDRLIAPSPPPSRPMAKTALRDKPDDTLQAQVHANLREITRHLLQAASAAHSADGQLELMDVRLSAALGDELETIAKRLNLASESLRAATASWEVLVARAQDKRRK